MTDDRKSGALPALAVAALAFAAFLPSLASPRACIDPDGTLSISTIATPRNIPAIFSSDFLFYTEGQYRPTGYAVLSFGRLLARPDNVRLWGAWLVAFHALGAVAVFFIARRLASRLWPALAAAALFAVHPLASLWAGDAARFPMVFGGLLTLASLACYLRFLLTRGAAAFAASLVLFATGLLASRAAWALPPVLLILELAWQRARPAPALARFASFVCVAVAAGMVASSIRPSPARFVYPDAAIGSDAISFYTFIATAPDFLRAIFTGRGFLAPPGEFANNVISWTDPLFLAAAGVALALAAFAVYELARRRWIGLGILLGIASALPFSSLAWHRVSARLSWDAWYLPAAGATLALGALADALAGSRRRAVRVAAASLAVAWVGAFAVMLARENVERRDPVSWFTRIADASPRSETANRHLGGALFAAGRRAEALDRLFSPSTRSIPRSSLVAGLGYLRDNELLAAAVHFLRAEKFEESDVVTRNRIVLFTARLLLAWGANDFAEASAANALTMDPWSAPAMNIIAKSLLDKGYLRAARRFAERAHEIVPDDPEAVQILAQLDAAETAGAGDAPRSVRPPPPAVLRYVVGEQRTPELCRIMTALASRLSEDPVLQAEAGMCLLSEGRAEAARQRLSAAAARLPNHPYLWSMAGAGGPDEIGTTRAPMPGERDATFWNHMGYLLYQRGSLNEAVACFHAAIDADPRFVSAHNNLGLVLILEGKRDEAVACYRTAIRLDPASADARHNLASALIAARDYAGALVTLEEGLRATPSDREIRMKLAWVLSAAPDDSVRSGTRAVKLAEEAIAESGIRRAGDVAILAAAYAESGDFDRACATASQAMTLARAERYPELVEAIAERLACYEKHSTWKMK